VFTLYLTGHREVIHAGMCKCRPSATDGSLEDQNFGNSA